MAKEEKKKTKRPTAEKRDIRNHKKQLINKVFKSRVRTTMRGFEEALKSCEKDQIQQSLNLVYGMMDMGLKRGLYKQNKVNRLKAHAAARVSEQAS